MANVKHVGKMNSGQRVVVLFKTVPNETHNCLVTETAALPRDYHDRIMELVESDEGQQSADLADLLSRRFFSDGNNILSVLHTKGFIKKVNTKNVLLTPNVSTSVLLSEVNQFLLHKTDPKKADPTVLAKPHYASQTEPVVTDPPSMTDLLATAPSVASTAAVSNEAKFLLQQAEFYEREAARLRSLAGAAGASDTTTNTDAKEQKKRGRPPKTAAVG